MPAFGFADLLATSGLRRASQGDGRTKAPGCQAGLEVGTEHHPKRHQTSPIPTDGNGLLADIVAREAQTPTGLLDSLAESSRHTIK